MQTFLWLVTQSWGRNAWRTLRTSAWEATFTFREANQFYPNSLCINTEGLLLYHCLLRQYVIFITDVDECESAESNECHFNASCNNTEGSYTCRCLDGYQGDGKNCTGKYHLSLPELTCHQSYKETVVLFLLSKLSSLAVLHLAVQTRFVRTVMDDPFVPVILVTKATDIIAQVCRLIRFLA